MGYEVDFLAVGDGEKSGDAIALRFGDLYGARKEQSVVVIDGGTRASGEKLVEHVGSYYGTSEVDLVISTHPDGDHVSGLKVVLEELEVGELWMHQPWDHTDDIAALFHDGRVTDNSVREKLRESLEAARSLEELAQSKGINIVEPFQGRIDPSQHLIVLGPTQSFYEEQLPDFRGTPKAKLDSILAKTLFSDAMAFAEKLIDEDWNYETLTDSGDTSAENDTSVITLFSFDNRVLLFTGDAGIPALTVAVDFLEGLSFDLSNLELIQIPHHGSKRNVGPSILNRLIGPKQRTFQKTTSAFISASKNGAPKHPAKKVTNAFKRRGAEVYSTQGKSIWHSYDAPTREGWTSLSPVPFYSQVDE